MRLVILILAFASLNLANAFTLNNNLSITFDHDEVEVNIVSGTCNNTNIGVSEQELLSIVAQAVEQYWNRAPTSRLKLRAGTIISSAKDFSGGLICSSSSASSCEPNAALAVDKDVYIACNTNASNFLSSSVLAVTVPNNIEDRTIIGSLILINALNSSTFKNKSDEDKVSIIAHELGHTFGLGHSPVKDSLMYYSTIDFRSSLGADDIDGISYLYPKQQPISCGSLNDSNKTKPWGGMLVGFFLAILLSKLATHYFERYLKLRPRF